VRVSLGQKEGPIPMKKNGLAAGMIIIMIFGMVLYGCSNGTTDSGSSSAKFEGTWASDYRKLQFVGNFCKVSAKLANGTWSDPDTQNFIFPFTFTDTTINIKNAKGLWEAEFSYILTDSALVLTKLLSDFRGDMVITGTYIKQK
jgi:hypothetical protein